MMLRFTRGVGFTAILVISGWLMGVTTGEDSIGVYWGQNSDEGSLKGACDSGPYSAVIIAYLTNFGGGRNPYLNISSHCNFKSGNCTNVANDIRHCQWQNVRILLSIGGAAGGYSIDSAADVSNVSSYLWNTFFGGTSSSRPFGNVTLDGIDFDVDNTPGDSEYYADLALSLRNHSRGSRLLYLSASARCQITQSKLRTLLNRNLLAYIWVHFYNNTACEYNSSSPVYPDGSSLRFANLMSSWSQWTSLNNSATVFLKLPASADAAKSGFIPPADLFEFLSIIRTSRNYGGLMLWSRYYDIQTQYASKLLNYTATAAAPTPLPTLPPSTPLAPGSPNPDAPPKSTSRVPVIAGATAAAAVTLLFLIAVSSFFFGKNHAIMVRKRLNCLYVFRKSRRYHQDEDYVDQLVPGLLTRFRYQTLVEATENFSEKLGEGGYGSVFAGTLRDGTEIAVKCLDGIGPVKKSFLAEVETIGSIHHINLVRLVGYCSEESRAILVYEYLSNGSLDKWIFHNDPELSLDWETRKKIISGVAKGLVYLHEECRQKIAHLDIKPQNILLTESFDAKLGDFGLSKLIHRGENLVVSKMRGTIGYLAPDWLGSVITEKVDVYSFGVVVLEILCGRRNLDRSLPEDSEHLLSLMKTKAEENRLRDLVDRNSADMQLHAGEVVEMMKVAAWCLQNDVAKRPSMSVVVKVLEGMMGVENDLDYNFFMPPEVAADKQHVLALSPVYPSILSGPRLGLRTIKQATEATISMCIYIIWKGRNARVFRGEERNIHKLKKETMQELNLILDKIEKLKISSKNIYWANKLGIDPAYIKKKKIKRNDN